MCTLPDCLGVRRICSKGKYLDPILIDLLDDKVGLIEHKSRMNFVDALLHNLERLFFCQSFLPILIIYGGAKVLRVSLRTVSDFMKSTKVIQVIQGATCFFVIARQQDVDLKGSFSEGGCQLSAGKVGLCVCG